MSAYPSKEEAQKAKLVLEGEEEDEAMEEEVEEEAGEEDGDNKDEQQKEEEEEAFKKQCKTSPKKVGKKSSPNKSAEKERIGLGSEETGEDKEREPTVEAKDKTDETGEKGEEDEESPKPGGMLLFGTLFKYMDKDKEDGVEKNTEQNTSESKMGELSRNDDKEESVSMEEEDRSKAGEVDEPDLTTPPPPQDEMDTASVPPSI